MTDKDTIWFKRNDSGVLVAMDECYEELARFDESGETMTHFPCATKNQIEDMERQIKGVLRINGTITDEQLFEGSLTVTV